MDSDNYRTITSMATSDEERNKVHLLTEWLTSHKGVHSIPDPYYGGEHDFDYALDLIEEACANLLSEL